jgi:site-specific recombinase XerD
MSARTPLTPFEEAAVLGVLSRFNPRDRLLVLMGLRTGLRVTELLSLTVGQVWHGGAPRTEIVIPRRCVKFGRGVRARTVRSRVLVVGNSVRSAVADLLGPDAAAGTLDVEAPLFRSRVKGGRLQRWRANRIVKGIIQAAGCRPDATWGTHSLRKSFARSVHKAAGGDIMITMAALGHAKIDTTQRYLAEDIDTVHRIVLALG